MILWLACASAVPTDSEAEPSALVPLEGAALARRISLDVRGVPPSLEELDQVEQDPQALRSMTEGWLLQPEHEERLVQVLGDQWLTRVDEFLITPDQADAADIEYDWLRAVGEEPLRLMARVGVSDRPWTETVTADWTMAEDILLERWPLEELESGEGWRLAKYTDGRPAGGVLMSSGLWWRYSTTLNNYNRGRALAVARHLVCHDFLDRPVDFEGLDEFTTEALLAATREVPGCVTCHASVDPIASALFGFWAFNNKDPYEVTRYHPEKEPLGEHYLGQPPEFFGTPVESAEMLGPTVAADPRFTRCAVQRFSSSFWRRPVDARDMERLDELEASFEAGDLRLSALLVAIIETPEYRVGAVLDADDAETPTRRTMRVDQLAASVEQLTGYRWTQGGWDQLDNDQVGVRLLAGGIDGVVVTDPADDPTLTHALVLRRLSQAAAAHVVAEDLDASSRRLLPDGIELLQPSLEEVEEGLVHLHRRIHGLPPEPDLLAADVELFERVEEEAGAEQAWASLISVMLRDPRFWTY